MAKKKNAGGEGRNVSDVVSIIGPGMKIEGDCRTDGTIRVEGRVDGSVRATKAVVIGKDGLVVGDVETQDAVVAGRVQGSIAAKSRVELQATCRIEGDIKSRRVKLEEGGTVDGRLKMDGSDASPKSSPQFSTKGAS